MQPYNYYNAAEFYIKMKSNIFTVLRLVCLLQILVMCACSLETAEYFVSPNGNDRNSGDEQHPLATLEQAKTLAFTDLSTGVRKQLTIWLEPGEYHIKNPIDFSSSELPTDGFNLTIKCKEKGVAIISGAIMLDQWYPLQNNLWALDLDQLENSPPYLRELFINGKRAQRSRFPNQGYLRAEKVGEDKRTYFYFRKGDFPIPRSVQQTELTLLHDWSITRIPIASIDTQENLIRAKDTIGAKVLDFFTLDNWELQPRYFLENDSTFIDQDYEWCYDSKAHRVLLQIPEEQNIDSLHVLIPLSEGLIKMTGSFDKPLKNMHFENLILRHSAWNLPSSGYAGIQATHHDPRPDQAQGWSVVPAAIYAEFTDSCSFINCSLENLGGSGLWLGRGCADNLVSNCTFSDISGNGIMIGEGQHRVVHGEPWWKTVPNEAARNNLIETCQINDCGIQFFGAVGIWCGLANGTRINNNEIFDLPYTGVSIGWMWNPTPTPAKNNLVSNNHIHHIMQKLSDGGGIYMLGLQPGSKLIGNLIHDVTVNVGRAESNGMFLDEGITDVLVANNIIYNIARSPIRFHKATQNVVRDNYLFCGTGVPPFTYNRTDSTLIKKADNKVYRASDVHYQKALEAILAKR